MKRYFHQSSQAGIGRRRPLLLIVAECGVSISVMEKMAPVMRA